MYICTTLLETGTSRHFRKAAVHKDRRRNFVHFPASEHVFQDTTSHIVHYSVQVLLSTRSSWQILQDSFQVYEEKHVYLPTQVVFL